MTGLRRKIAKEKLKEWLIYDCQTTQLLIAFLGLLIGILLLIAGRNLKGTSVLAGLHRANLSEAADKIIQQLFKSALSDRPKGLSRKIASAIHSYPDQVPISGNVKRFTDDPKEILNGCTLVLKSPATNEKGVLYLYYSYLYPLLLREFDTEEITKRYRLVLEPSWSGFCDLNILCTTKLQQDIVVGFGEARDAKFLKEVSHTLIPGNFTGNTWIDTDVFRPIHTQEKDIDVIVVASWAWYKRHWAIFKAVRTLKNRGIRLRVALVGYPVDMKLVDLKQIASYYGILEQIEFHERLSPDAVNALLNRSKVNLLWSRREGTPRTIPEGLAAGVPAIMRKGFNYGAQHAYINDQTGIYSDERNLPDDILRVIAKPSSFNPRPWVVHHMTPEVSTRNLNESLEHIARRNSEHFTTNAEIKVSTLDGLRHKDPSNVRKFQADNDFLARCIRDSAKRPPKIQT